MNLVKVELFQTSATVSITHMGNPTNVWKIFSALHPPILSSYISTIIINVFNILNESEIYCSCLQTTLSDPLYQPLPIYLLNSLPEPSGTFSSFESTNEDEVSTLFSYSYSTTSLLDRNQLPSAASIVLEEVGEVELVTITLIVLEEIRDTEIKFSFCIMRLSGAQHSFIALHLLFMGVPSIMYFVLKTRVFRGPAGHERHSQSRREKLQMSETLQSGTRRLHEEMHKNNISHIFILGFPNLHSLNCLLFMFLLIVYCVTICGNVIIIFLVSKSNSLHSPMYFFITIIALMDIMMTTDILPNLLHIVLHNGGTVSLACILQFFVFGKSEVFECFILMVMSYDRYVAICNPLRYRRFCEISVIASWSLSFLLVLMNAVATFILDFCGPNVIDNFFCDFTPIIELSCSDTSVLENQTTLIVIIALVFPFIIIFISYVYIITTILSIRSISGRQKAFSTCSSHLTVVCIFFGSLITVYIVPTKGQLRAISKILSLLYTVVTPLLNPFIYSLRNKDLKKAFEKCKWNLSDFMNNFRYKREKHLRIN
ncbi:olfactory receptor 5G25-like [Pseudophryne corroboree]|uniref:olfactory receptor 5G25-like n=1 Tax=Pseudophryne corroboree TaxID=495146 RepID=UPI003081DC76